MQKYIKNANHELTKATKELNKAVKEKKQDKKDKITDKVKSELLMLAEDLKTIRKSIATTPELDL